jgi:FkbM family methyltransferase
MARTWPASRQNNPEYLASLRPGVSRSATLVSVNALENFVQQILKRCGLLIVRLPHEGTLGRELGRVIAQRNIRTLVDVGAHEGLYGERWRALGFSGRIISFEPGEGPFKRLQQRAGDLWEVHQLAIGNVSGVAEFFEYEESEEYASLRRPSGRLGMPPLTVCRSYPADVQTLDHILPRLQVDVSSSFLKIDTQGHDAAVLDGAKESLGTAAAVQVEIPMFGLYEEAPRAEELIHRIRDAGFDLIGMFPVHDHPRSLVPIEFDGLFVRSGEAPG